jgi:TPR repeat protein
MSRSVEVVAESSREPAANSNNKEELFRKGLGYDLQDNVAEAKIYYQQSADQGSAKAMNNLGAIFRREGNLSEAERYYRLAADLDLPCAQYNLAILREEQGNHNEAQVLLRKAADADEGDPDARYRMGLLLEQENPEESKRYFLRAAGKAHRGAYYKLGTLVEQHDTEKAHTYYERASEKGHTDAPYRRALLYEKESKNDIARTFFHLAAERGNAEAQLKLALLFQKEGAIRDAQKFFEQAAHNNSVLAPYYLGRIYRQQGNFEKAAACFKIQTTNPFKECSVDLVTIRKVRRLFKVAAEAGDLDAHYHAGILYTAEDKLEQAKKFFKYGNERSHVQSLCGLAHVYLKCHKHEKANLCFKKAANAGDQDAQFQLAFIYEKAGKKDKAMKLLLHLVDQGYGPALLKTYDLLTDDDQAIAELDRLLVTRSQQDDSIALYLLGLQAEKKGELHRAYDLFIRSAAQGYVTAKFKLGKVYESNSDGHQAKIWYSRAADDGHAEAAYRMAKLYQAKGEWTDEEYYYKEAVRKGYTEAEYDLGVLYYNEGCKHRIDDAETVVYVQKMFEKAEVCLRKCIGDQRAESLLEVIATKKVMMGTPTRGGVPTTQPDVPKETAVSLPLAVPSEPVSQQEGGVKQTADNQLVHHNQIADDSEEERERLYLIAASKGNQAAYYQLAAMYKAKAEFNKAKTYFEKILPHTADQQPHNIYAEAQYNLGHIYQLENDPMNSVACYERAAEQGNNPAQYALGKLYQAKQQFEKALSYFEKIVPDARDHWYQHPRSLYARAQYHLGCILEQMPHDTCVIKQMNRETEAVKCYQRASEEGKAVAQYRLGEIYKARGENDIAMLYFGKISAYYSRNSLFARAQYHIGCICEQDGRKKLALQHYQRAAEGGLQLAQERVSVLLQDKEATESEQSASQSRSYEELD